MEESIESIDINHINTLSVVIEEQRMRLDSVIAGSTVIPSIHNDILKLHSLCKEISEHLNLPQPQNIPRQFQGFQDFLMTIDHRAEDMSNDLKQMKNRMLLLEKSQSVVDAKMTMGTLNGGSINDSGALLPKSTRPPRFMSQLGDSSAGGIDSLIDIKKLKKAAKRLLNECASLRSLVTGQEVRIVALEEITADASHLHAQDVYL